MMIPENFTFDETNLLLSLDRPNNKRRLEEYDSKNFRWETDSINQNKVLIQIFFEEVSSMSLFESDILYVSLLDNLVLLSKETLLNLVLEGDGFVQHTIPK